MFLAGAVSTWWEARRWIGRCQCLQEVLSGSCREDIETLLFVPTPRQPFAHSPTLISRITTGISRPLNPHNPNVLSIHCLARGCLQPPYDSRETNNGSLDTSLFSSLLTPTPAALFRSLRTRQELGPNPTNTPTLQRRHQSPAPYTPQQS